VRHSTPLGLLTWEKDQDQRINEPKQKKKPTKKSIFIIANSNNRYLETTGAGKQSITILFIGKGKELFGSWVQTYFFGRCGSHRTEWG
jgi:hypothetical protein